MREHTLHVLQACCALSVKAPNFTSDSSTCAYNFCAMYGLATMCQEEIDIRSPQVQQFSHKGCGADGSASVSNSYEADSDTALYM